MVSSEKRRVEKLEGALTPKQAMLMWLQDAHKFNTVNEYVDHMKDQPDSAWPMGQLLLATSKSVPLLLRRDQGEMAVL